MKIIVERNNSEYTMNSKLYQELYELIIVPYIEKERAYAETHSTQRDVWLRYRNERVAIIACFCAERYTGDIVEIGCHAGNMTRQFAEIAREYGHRVIAVDPWIPGQEQCQEDTYALFQKNISAYQNTVDVIRKPSQEREAIAYIQQRDLCFAYIDGLHTTKAAFSDIAAVSHCAGLICVDDIDSSPGVAFRQAAERLGRRMLYHEKFIEGYLLPR